MKKTTPLNFKQILKDLPNVVVKKWIMKEFRVCPYCLDKGKITEMCCKEHNYVYANWYLGLMRSFLDIPKSEKITFNTLMKKVLV